MTIYDESQVLAEQDDRGRRLSKIDADRWKYRDTAWPDLTIWELALAVARTDQAAIETKRRYAEAMSRFIGTIPKETP